MWRIALAGTELARVKRVIFCWGVVLAAGCSGASAMGAGASPATVAGVAAPAAAPPQPFVDRAPGPIAGSYRVTCAENEGEIIEFTVAGQKAVGRVAEPGTAKKYGFQKGEEVFRLTPDSYGDWVGEVRFRSVTGAQHWDGVRLVATDALLSATITNEPCYRSMPRVR